MRVIVDNSQGADPAFAAGLHGDLTAAGFEVEVREPVAKSMFDTTVHFIVEGVCVRVSEDPGREQLATLVETVRSAQQRRSERQRFRAVPVYRGETQDVLAWVDVFA